MITKEVNRFYNYLYLDPKKPGEYPIKGLNIILKHEPFYVGKGTGKRIHQHLNGYSGPFMKNKIISLKGKGLDPIAIKLIDSISNFEACSNERYLIRIIGRRDLGLGPLTNLTDGGEGTTGAIQSLETKNKRSKSLSGINNPNYGKRGIDSKAYGNKNWLNKKHSEETKKKMSENSKGDKNYAYGKKVPKEIVDKRAEENKISIIQFDLNNNIIRDWDSAKDAGDTLKLDRSSITKCCRGKLKRVGKFKWRYKNINNDK